MGISISRGLLSASLRNAKSNPAFFAEQAVWAPNLEDAEACIMRCRFVISFIGTLCAVTARFGVPREPKVVPFEALQPSHEKNLWRPRGHEPLLGVFWAESNLCSAAVWLKGFVQELVNVRHLSRNSIQKWGCSIWSPESHESGRPELPPGLQARK